MIIRIRSLLDIRQQHTDQALLDYLTLVTLAPSPGRVPTSELRKRWGCSQSQVSRRMAAVARTGLVDITATCGAYQVHGVEVVA
jgi:DNA-binding IclR family transcriptional regulator